MFYTDDALIKVANDFLHKSFSDIAEKSAVLEGYQEGERVYCYVYFRKSNTTISFNVRVEDLVRAGTVEEAEAMFAGAFTREFARLSTERFFESTFNGVEKGSILERLNLALCVTNCIIESANHLCQTYGYSQDSKIKRSYESQKGRYFERGHLKVTGEC